jgi:hypothetical protein
MLAAHQSPAENEELAPLMPEQEPAPAAPLPSAAAAPPPTPGKIDREFVAKNRLVERYIGGRLPVRGAKDLERFCRENPDLLDEINLTQNINSALRLLDASGRASPWEPEPKKWWEKPHVLIAAAALAFVFGITALTLSSKLGGRDRAIDELKRVVATQPLEAVTQTRPITVIPNRIAPSTRSLVTIGGGVTQMADLKIDMSWTPMNLFRVTIDRIDQGRVAILHNVQRDSNGTIHLELNSSALGPGDYQLTIEGLNWRGEPIPQAWATISIAH